MELYALGKNIIAFTTDRRQGRSRESIYNMLREYAKNMGIEVTLDDNRYMFPHQTHTDRVMRVTNDYFNLDEEGRKKIREGIDAVISSERNAVIGISTADCIPVLVYDPIHHVAAAIHAGWKGTVSRIVEKAISKLHKDFDTDPSVCTAVVGPGISQESFEVGQEVVDRFIAEGFDMDRYTVQMPDMHGGNGVKPHIDLKKINRDQLVTAGVKSENITVSGIDTYTDERFFSARREQQPPLPDGTVIKCGRILSGFILL